MEMDTPGASRLPEWLRAEIRPLWTSIRRTSATCWWRSVRARRRRTRGPVENDSPLPPAHPRRLAPPTRLTCQRHASLRACAARGIHGCTDMRAPTIFRRILSCTREEGPACAPKARPCLPCAARPCPPDRRSPRRPDRSATGALGTIVSFALLAVREFGGSVGGGCTDRPVRAAVGVRVQRALAPVRRRARRCALLVAWRARGIWATAPFAGAVVTLLARGAGRAADALRLSSPGCSAAWAYAALLAWGPKRATSGRSCST